MRQQARAPLSSSDLCDGVTRTADASDVVVKTTAFLNDSSSERQLRACCRVLTCSAICTDLGKAVGVVHVRVVGCKLVALLAGAGAAHPGGGARGPRELGRPLVAAELLRPALHVTCKAARTICPVVVNSVLAGMFLGSVQASCRA